MMSLVPLFMTTVRQNTVAEVSCLYAPRRLSIHHALLGQTNCSGKITTPTGACLLHDTGAQHCQVTSLAYNYISVGS